MAFKYKNELKTKKERALIPAVFELEKLESSNFRLDNQTKLKILKEYETLYTKGFTNGRKRGDILRVLVYINLRNLKRPILSKDFDMNAKLFKKYLRRIVNILDITLEQKDLESYIIRFGSFFKLKPKTVSIALILSKVNILVDFDTKIFVPLSIASEITKDTLDMSQFSLDKQFKESCDKLRKSIRGKVLDEVNKYALFSNENS